MKCRLALVAESALDTPEVLKYGLGILGDLASVWEKSNLSTRQQLQGFVFPPRSHCGEVGVWNRPNRSLLAVRGAAGLCHYKCGGPTWIRTKNQVVMSHLLYR